MECNLYFCCQSLIKLIKVVAKPRYLVDYHFPIKLGQQPAPPSLVGLPGARICINHTELGEASPEGSQSPQVSVVFVSSPHTHRH